VTYQVVTWSPAQKAPSGQPYRVIGYINPQQVLDRVETWVEHPVLGDLHVETFFSDYADFGGGLLAPARITSAASAWRRMWRCFVKCAPIRPISLRC
jgi:hypothetical protein